jgi:hypothetical protein
LERSTGQRRSGAGEVEQRIPARGRRGKGTVLPRGPELSAAEWEKALRGLTRGIGPGTLGGGRPRGGPGRELGRVVRVEAAQAGKRLDRKKEGSGPRQGLGRLGLLRWAGPMREKKGHGQGMGWTGLSI